MKVWEALTKKTPVITIGPTETLATAIGLLVEARVRALPVVDEAKLVGIVTTHDILWHLDTQGSVALEQTVDTVMTRDPVTVGSDEPIEKIEQVFVQRDISHIPVLNENKLVGLLTPADVFGSHLGDIEWLNENLQAYVSGGFR